MPYDHELAGRIRALLAADMEPAEQRMFGGLAFLLGGNMAIAASSEGGLIVRVDPASSEMLVATTAAYPLEMQGRPMRGWLRVDAGHLRDDAELARWVELGTAYARSLPAKR